MSTTKKQRYTPMVPVHLYRHAKAGLSDEAIARVLGVSRNTVKNWKAGKPECAEALELARSQVPSENGFVRYFYSQLDPRLQELWDRITLADNAGGIEYIDRILADHGRRARQSLFLHALVFCHFSPTRAMERVGIDKRQLDTWCSTDPDFAELVEEIPYHKGNFFEEALVKKVEQGELQAILFANRTYNKTRGYGASTDVNVRVSGSVESRSVLDLAELDLDLDTQKKIVEAIRKRDERREKERLIGQMPADERAALLLGNRIAEAAEV